MSPLTPGLGKIEVERRAALDEPRSSVETIDHQMLQIKSLYRSASLCFSEYTGKWYVMANIEIGGGGALVGVSQHESNPADAVDSYFRALTSIPSDRYLVTNAHNEGRTRHWRWNGAAFAEVPR